MKSIRKQSGFTLIELLIVVAIIGIIAAIAIPNLLNAIDRGKQKRTMADMRSIGTAVEAYAVDVNFYPAGIALSDVSANLEQHITPTFIKDAPDVDGWGGPFRYESDTTGSEYTILSYGKDNADSANTTQKTTDFDCDIIYQNGGFVSWPEGIQT
jgi:general secretion pathway protein G